MDNIPDDIFERAEEIANSEILTTASLVRAIHAERLACAAFADEKYDWPACWIAVSFRGENSSYTEHVRDLKKNL